MDAKTATLSTLALEQFKERRDKNKGRKVDNSLLPAGSPTYYYCRYCSTVTAVLPESHTSIPKRVCEPCEALTNQGVDLTMVPHTRSPALEEPSHE